MTDLSPIDRSITAAAAQYIDARGKDGRLISVAAGVRALRAALPGCPLSDRELAQLIAEAAVSKGCNVHFNASEAA